MKIFRLMFGFVSVFFIFVPTKPFFMPTDNQIIVASFFGCSTENVKRQYAQNAEVLEKMRDKAIATGKKVNNYTAEELTQRAKRFRELSK